MCICGGIGAHLYADANINNIDNDNDNDTGGTMDKAYLCKGW